MFFVKKIPWLINAIFEPATVVIIFCNFLIIQQFFFFFFCHKRNEAWILVINMIHRCYLPKLLKECLQVCMFVVDIIVCFRSDIHGPWWLFSNKKYFVLVRFYLWKNWDSDIQKNKTKIIVYNSNKN